MCIGKKGAKALQKWFLIFKRPLDIGITEKRTLVDTRVLFLFKIKEG